MEEELLRSAERGDAEQVTKLLDVDKVDKDFADNVSTRFLIDLTHHMPHGIITPSISPSSAQWANTALHFAASNGRLSVVNVLLDHGASVTVRNMVGNEPLHDAVEKGHKDCIEALLTKGTANPNSTNMYGWTALHFAGVHGSVENCELLVDNKADKSITNMVNAVKGLLARAELKRRARVSSCATVAARFALPLQFGYTASELAEREGNVGAATLLEYGAGGSKSGLAGLFCL